MNKVFKLKYILPVLFALCLIVSATFFSVSKAAWTNTNPQDISVSASTGRWVDPEYAVVTEDGQVFPLSQSGGSYGGTFYIDGDKNFNVMYNGVSLQCDVTVQADPAAERVSAREYRTTKGKGYYKAVTDGETLDVSLLFAKEFKELTDGDMKEILVANGCGTAGNEQGAVTSTGQVVKFDEPFTLQEGEQLVIYGAGKQAAEGAQIGKYGISIPQSSSGVSIDKSTVTANTAGEYQIRIVRGNTWGDQGLVNIYDWIAVKDGPNP